MTTLTTLATTRANLTRLDLAITRALQDCAVYGYEYTATVGLTRIGDNQWCPYDNDAVDAALEVVNHFQSHYNDRMWHSRLQLQQIEIACERILHAISKLEAVV